jgi:hypothetical protein
MTGRRGALVLSVACATGAWLPGCGSGTEHVSPIVPEPRASILANGGDPGPTVGPIRGPGRVRIVADAGGGFVLVRDEKPYYVRGVGGSVHMDLAASAGANSVRTWGSDQAEAAFAGAGPRGMTVLLGVWLSHDAAFYEADSYKNEKREELRALLAKYKDDPALLMWGIGNEINLSTNTKAAWSFVNELVRMVHEADPNHPAMTVLAGAPVEVIDEVVRDVPLVDVLGLNEYGDLTHADADVARSRYRGPYLVTEWGPQGHWEVPKTSWGRPVEPTSAAKASDYARRYEYIVDHRDRILGSYVFLWGQKEERTPTWYGMFAEDRPEIGLHGEAYPAVDVMYRAWRGAWPANRAPEVRALRLGEEGPRDGVTLTPSQPISAVVEATDPDGDDLSYAWETLEEATVLGTGGSKEPRPASVGAPVLGGSARLAFVAPARPGEYRLYAYALDGHGHVGTANLPFRVR